jgi:hypothetical protein
MIDKVDAVVSMACGCGVQEVARRYKGKRVFPAVNTKFMGASEAPGVWAERCQGCGDCVLGDHRRHLPHRPLLQAPAQRPLRRLHRRQVRDQPGCGLRLAAHLGQAVRTGLQDRYEEVMPAKDWRTGRGGGPRKIIREDLA